MREQKESQEAPKLAKKVVPRGKALERTDDELDEMFSAKNMEALAEEAAEEFEADAPREYSRILDTEQKDKS